MVAVFRFLGIATRKIQDSENTHGYHSQTIGRTYPLPNKNSIVDLHSISIEMIWIRREYDLGNGTFEWGEHPDSNVVVVKNSTVTLVLNMADYSATVPGEKAVLMASGPVDVTPEGIELPGNTVAWLI